MTASFENWLDTIEPNERPEEEDLAHFYIRSFVEEEEVEKRAAKRRTIDAYVDLVREFGLYDR